MAANVRESQATYAVNTVTLEIPEALYLRLRQAAAALHLSFDEVVRRALEVGGPPAWDDAPAEFQADLAALDRLSDDALWNIVRDAMLELDWTRYQELLDRNTEGSLTPAEKCELEQLRTVADRHMLRRAHAAALLRWRGHQIALSKSPGPQ